MNLCINKLNSCTKTYKPSLKELYQLFLIYFINSKYFEDINNINILGANFIDNLFIVVFQKNNRIFIIIENILTPIFIELKQVKNKDGYITIDKNFYSKVIPQKIREKLAKRGLCLTYATGMKNNKSLCLHRLITCLYFNCINKEVHHINKNKIDNYITNLIPLDAISHKRIDNDLLNGVNFAINEQEQLKSKLKKTRTTLANNEQILYEILSLKNKQLPVKKIIKIIKKIRKSKIYEIINYFYYSNEFKIWLKMQQNQTFQELYGKFFNEWKNVINYNFFNANKIEYFSENMQNK